MIGRGFLVALLTAGVAVVGAGYAAAFLPGGPPTWGAALVILGTAVSLVVAMALGAVKDGRIAGLGPTFAFVLVVVGGGLGALLVLPPADPGDPLLVLGLPLRAAILLYVVGLLPVLVVPVAYARTFEALTLDDDDLERVRRASGGADGAGGPAAPGGPRDAGDADERTVE